MTQEQGNALLDVLEECMEVAYAYRQCAYHQEHLASRHHESKCKLTKGDSTHCKNVGTKTSAALTTAIEKLKEYYKTAFELGVEESLLDITLYDLLPGDVFNAIYEEAA